MRNQRIWTIELEPSVADLLSTNFAFTHLIVPPTKHDTHFNSWGYRTRRAREEALISIARLLPTLWAGSHIAPWLRINSYWGSPA